MSELLDRNFTDKEKLKAELKKYRATLAEKPGKTIIDSSTGIVVETYTLFNSQKEGAGAVELVRAEEKMYNRLVESTGRIVGKEHERTGIRLF